MTTRSFQPHPVTLDDCIQAVIDVAHAHRLHLGEAVLGNMVRVHLGQTVLMRVYSPPMLALLSTTPLEALQYLPGPGGNHERAGRCVRLARHTLVLSSLNPDDRHQEVGDLVHAGTRAYKLAADAAASYDRWSGELWWELGTRFNRYRLIVTASCHYLDGIN